MTGYVMMNRGEFDLKRNKINNFKIVFPLGILTSAQQLTIIHIVRPQATVA